MNLFSRTVAVLGAMSLAAVSGSAMATIYSHGEIGNLTYKLIDLDPNDGLTPSIAFTALPNPALPAGYGASAYGYTEIDGIRTPAGVAGTGTIPLSLALQEGTTSASGVLTGRGAVTTHQISLDGQTSPDGDGLVESNVGLSTGAMRFVISPRATVLFSVDTRFTGGYTEEPGIYGEYLYGYAGLTLYGEAFLWSSGDYASVEYSSNSQFDHFDRRETLSMYQTNYSYDRRLGGFIAVSGGIRTSSYGSVVPEPATVWMMLAGVGVVAAGSRRRRKA